MSGGATEDLGIGFVELFLSCPKPDRGFNKADVVWGGIRDRLREVGEHAGGTSIGGIGVVVLPEVKVAVPDPPIRAARLQLRAARWCCSGRQTDRRSSECF